MGLKEAEALTLARKIGLFNTEAIYYVKNSLMFITLPIQKHLDDEHEKFIIIHKRIMKLISLLRKV